MNWFAARRRDYILWRLAVHGEVQRGDIIKHFGISMPQASFDINALLSERADSISYDKSRKRYVGRRHPPSAQLARVADALGWD